MSWHTLDTLLTRIRPHREPLALAIDAAVIAACWNITSLFRLGFERGWSARHDCTSSRPRGASRSRNVPSAPGWGRSAGHRRAAAGPGARVATATASCSFDKWPR